MKLIKLFPITVILSTSFCLSLSNKSTNLPFSWDGPVLHVGYSQYPQQSISTSNSLTNLFHSAGLNGTCRSEKFEMFVIDSSSDTQQELIRMKIVSKLSKSFKVKPLADIGPQSIYSVSYKNSTYAVSVNKLQDIVAFGICPFY